MIWRDETLKSPLTGKFLKRDSPHSLTDGTNRFPVVSDIPYLRARRDDLRRAVLRRLDAGDERNALSLLLQDRDDWASGEPPAEKDLQPLFAGEKLTLRAAMQHLKYGAVADYFAYRWSDPTFLSGLCLIDNHLPQRAKRVFELACGIGQFLREFDLRNIEAAGADVVFSKLWLARKFVAPHAKLVCFDANYDFPFAGNEFDAAFCHDAFYFLPEKKHAAAELLRAADGTVLIGHAHNSEAVNFSSGAAVSTDEYAAMFGNSTFYDDAELTEALIENRTPRARSVAELQKTEAVSLAANGRKSASAANFNLPAPNRRLRLNPLLEAGNFQVLKTPKYPSERYEEEYAPLSGYLNSNDEDTSLAVQEAMRGGRWSGDAELIELARRRIFLDLPEDW